METLVAMAIVMGLILLVLGVIAFKQWLSLPDRCPSCDSRFDEATVNVFCTIGDENVHFCKKCTSRPIGRLGINTAVFIGKGFSDKEISQLQNFIYEYKR